MSAWHKSFPATDETTDSANQHSQTSTTSSKNISVETVIPLFTEHDFPPLGSSAAVVPQRTVVSQPLQSSPQVEVQALPVPVQPSANNNQAPVTSQLDRKLE